MDDLPPLDGYGAMGAREVMRRILDLGRDELVHLHAYEERHLRRTHVLGAIRRAIGRSQGGHAAARTSS